MVLCARPQDSVLSVLVLREQVVFSTAGRSEESRVIRHVKTARCGEVSKNLRAISRVRILATGALARGSTHWATLGRYKLLNSNAMRVSIAFVNWFSLHQFMTAGKSENSRNRLTTENASTRDGSLVTSLRKASLRLIAPKRAFLNELAS